MKIPTLLRGHLVRKAENYGRSIGKLISAQSQRFRHWAQLLWTMEGAKVGTGAWHFFFFLQWMPAGLCKLSAKYNKGTWETNFKDVWDDAWDKQLLCMCSAHQSSRYIWDLGEKGESAASVSVDPRIPIAGVAEWPSIQGFAGSLPHDMSPTRKWACCTHVQLLQMGMDTEIPMLN